MAYQRTATPRRIEVTPRRKSAIRCQGMAAARNNTPSAKLAAMPAHCNPIKMLIEPRSWTDASRLDVFAARLAIPMISGTFQTRQAARNSAAAPVLVWINGSNGLLLLVFFEPRIFRLPSPTSLTEHAMKQVRLKQRLRIIAPLDVEEGVDSGIPKTAAILRLRHEVILGEIKSPSRANHQLDHLAQHPLQCAGILVGPPIVQLKGKPVKLIAEQKGIWPVLLDDTPDGHAPMLLRVAQYVRKYLSCQVAGNKSLERLDAVWEQRVISRKGRGRIEGIGDQGALLGGPVAVEPIPPVTSAVCHAHTTHDSWTA